MQRKTHALWTALCLVALATVMMAGSARADEVMSKAARHRQLRSAYDAFKRDSGLKALESRANANLNDRTAVEALLKRMPLSPLEYLQIDMEVKHYEIFIPEYILKLHLRWVELNDKRARELYGDQEVDRLLSGWPADTGRDVLGDWGLWTKAVTVGTNRDVASTATPAPTDYDGEIQIAVNPHNLNRRTT